LKDNIVKEKSFLFAINSIDLYKAIIEQKEFILSKQFLRSATSTGANIEEATAGFSRKDFINKLAIASKEARETHYWLRLLEHYHKEINFTAIKSDCEELIKILTSIISTSQENIKN
jgi:four helix bundle protein